MCFYILHHSFGFPVIVQEGGSRDPYDHPRSAPASPYKNFLYHGSSSAWVSEILGKQEQKRKAGTGTHKIRCKRLFPPCFLY